MVYQKACDNIKTTIAKDASLAYPDSSMEFEIYIDASSKQLGSFITQGKQETVHGAIKRHCDQT